MTLYNPQLGHDQENLLLQKMAMESSIIGRLAQVSGAL